MKNDNGSVAAALIKIKACEAACIPDDSEIDHVFSDRFELGMDEIFSSLESGGINKRSGTRTFVKAASIIIAIALSVFSLMMINPSVRADFRNAVFEFYNNRIKFHFVSGAESEYDFKNIEKINVEYIPKGFALKKTDHEYEAVNYSYVNSEESLTFDVYISLNSGLSVQTGKGNSQPEKITIGGREAYLVCGENGGKPYSTCIITGNTVTVTIYGQLTRQEIIKVGKSLKETQ